MTAIPKYFSYEELTGNDVLTKRCFTLNGAGDSENNPIAIGAPLAYYLRFNESEITPRVYIGQTSPAQDQEITLTQMTGQNIYYFQGKTGETFLDYLGQTYLRIQNFFLSEKISEYERSFYLANLTTSSIQIYANGGWRDAYGLTVNSCTPHCPIRFFNAWQDEFSIHHFGGFKYVSIYDQGTNENDTSQNMVGRIYCKPIQQVKVIYLVRHYHHLIENHKLIIRLRTALPTTYPGNYLDLSLNLNTVQCLGLIPRMPLNVWSHGYTFWTTPTYGEIT